MIYPRTIESKIGFDQVRQLVKERCVSPQGKETVDKMSWITDRELLITCLSRVDELKRLKQGGTNELALTPIVDARPWLSKIEVSGMFIEANNLLSLSRSLNTASGIKRYFNREEQQRLYPYLTDLSRDIADVDIVKRYIEKVIDDLGQVKDNASPRLGEIRREMSTIARRTNAAMRRVIQSAISAGLIDADTAPSVRDGRLVIPVAPTHKREIEGIVHDYSASGKTIFIEPASVVELSNRQRELEIEERREIIKILVEVADNIRPHLAELYTVNGVLAEFDFIAAKAEFAISVGGNMPRLSKDNGFDWAKAVHPMLYLHLKESGREIVPLDIKLDGNQARIVVVSGPNAGGKSVALKTAGIIQYMTQCGMLPTMRQGSTVMLMDNLFVDIGDDQSFDDDLSTYSSHLTAMKYFVTHGTKRTLFLADEMGSGTEPQIGGAIAQALLEEFNNLGMWGIVTTHYQNLKTLADSTAGFINASMLYDRQAMAPLFKMALGHPGSSFAIEIARKIGFPAKIIDKAGEIVGSDYVNLDKYLLDIARDKRYWAEKRENIRRRNKDLENKIEEYSRQSDELRHQRKTIIDEARREAKEIVQSSNAAIERTIREIREADADKQRTREARAKLADFANEITTEQPDKFKEKIAPSVATRKQRKKRGHDKPVAEVNNMLETDQSRVQTGSWVKLDGKGTPGKVLSIDENKAMVAFGAIKLNVDIKRLKIASEVKINDNQRPSVATTQTMSDSRQRQLNFKTELDVRGFRADQAIQAITYFIDDAIQFSISRVRILHGTGTGALRMTTRQYLQSIPQVVRFHDEDVRFGGTGITVVELE